MLLIRRKYDQSIIRGHENDIKQWKKDEEREKWLEQRRKIREE